LELLKLGDRVEDSEKQPISLRLPEAMIGLRLGDASKGLVGETAEHIVCAKLGTLGISCERRHICPECKYQNMPEYTDLIAYKPLKKSENPVKVPVQVKSCSRKLNPVVARSTVGRYVSMISHSKPSRVFTSFYLSMSPMIFFYISKVTG